MSVQLQLESKSHQCEGLPSTAACSVGDPLQHVAGSCKLPSATVMQTLPSASVGVRGHKSSQAVHHAALACSDLLIMTKQEGQEKVWWEVRTSPSMHPAMVGLPAQAVHPVSILGGHCAGFECQKRFGVSAQDVQEAKAKTVRNGEVICTCLGQEKA